MRLDLHGLLCADRRVEELLHAARLKRSDEARGETAKNGRQNAGEMLGILGYSTGHHNTLRGFSVLSSVGWTVFV